MDEKILCSMIKDIDKYYAHIIENVNNEVIKVELLDEHIERTYKYFKRIYNEKLIDEVVKRILQNLFADPSEEMYKFFEEMIIGIPVFHDYGKINPSFQKNLMKNKWFSDINLELCGINSRHSFLSALAYIEYFRSALKTGKMEKKEKPLLRFFMIINSYIISRHHSDLSDMKEYQGLLLKENMDEILQYLRVISKWEEIQLNPGRIRSLCKDTYDQILETLTRQQSIDVYVYVKLMYSLLVASDYYATSEYMNGVKITDFGNSKELGLWKKVYEETELMGNIREYQKNIYPKDSYEFMNEKDINVLRTEILCDSEKNLKENIKKNIFYLEAPTGSGKSNTAINLTFQLTESEDRLRKIFYIYPFNTLVEQNIKSLSKIFGDNPEILNRIAVINSLTPIKTDNEKKKTEEQEEFGNYYQRALLDRQFLNYPMILSTHVTLFNTIFGETKESAFGFHQLCNSIIILDEIQSYKNSIWGEIICFLKELAFLLNIKIIIMSATLPDLDLLSDEMCPAVRLLPESRKYFDHPCFKKRVELSYELMDVEDIEEKLFDHVKHQVVDGKKVLIEFITRASAEKFFRKIKEDDEIKDFAEYMSGADSVIERKRILDFIENTVNPVVLVATQVVEAGVDIDMDVGYKNISKLDSEEQFLGRINRSCKKADCIVYFFQMDDSKKIYGTDEVRTNRNLTLENQEMRELLINKDFSLYYHKVLSVLKKNISENKSNGINDFFDEKMRSLQFKNVKEKMQLIKEDDWSISVFFARDIKDIDGSEISGVQVWNEYSSLLNDFSMDYSERKVKLSRITSKMSYFIYQVKKTCDLIYNDRIGELYYIEDGEQYFQDDKLNLEKIENSVTFI